MKVAYKNNPELESLREISTGWFTRYEVEVCTVDIRAMKEGFVHKSRIGQSPAIERSPIT